MFSKPKNLTFELDTADLSINHINNLYNTFFHSKDYDWWYEILPGDVCVDIGSNIGMFSAKALDAGAKRVYMIEPNRELLKVGIKNCAEAYIGMQQDELPKLIPINAAMGRTDIDLSLMYGEQDDDVKLMSLRELTDYYDIFQIDYLKVSANGAEFNILHEDNLEFLGQSVRFIAVRVNLNSFYGSDVRFEHWRDTVVKPFIDMGRVYTQDNSILNTMFVSNWKEVLPQNFMLYIKNW
jgi:FkbM family methyltransferase